MRGEERMPTYVYECASCEQTIEVEQRITESPLTDCQCGAQGSLKRIIQPVGVMFKGSGFYVNDTSSSPATPAPSAPAAECTGTPSACPACAPAE